MHPLNFLTTSAGVTIADAVFALGLPPSTYGLVDSWNVSTRTVGVVPEFRLEIWANLPVDLTNAQLYGAATHPLVVADTVFTAVGATEIFTATAHGLFTGDGPIQVSNAGGALPAGLVAATDYWVIKIDADTFYLAASRTLALVGTHLFITTNGTGTQTLADTSSTERVHWHSLGLLGPAEDGAISLTGQLGYATRRSHDPRTFAYALAGTMSTENPEAVSAKVYPIQDR